jgi:hypothetical protein
LEYLSSTNALKNLVLWCVLVGLTVHMHGGNELRTVEC